jgi:DNA-binding NtrC family response regulator
MARILVVDGDRAARGSVEAALRKDGHEVAAVGSAEEALASPHDGSIDLVIADVALPGMGGMALLREFARERADAAVVMMGSRESIDDAVEAMELGARSFLRKPLDPDHLAAVVARVLAPQAERLPPPGAGDPCADIVGASPRIVSLLQLVKQVAATDSTVLVTGETGTGKELIGQALHRASRRRDRVFCAINSAAFTETLLESELFGYRRGAFTGAASNKKGLFEYADRGTVFLDEVAEMPLSMQAKLLRFLQSGEIRPVGSEYSRRVDVRLVAATNKDLEREVEAGRFREDLYYRLAVIPMHVPALRERPEDIALLARHFVERYAAAAGRHVEGIEPEALEALGAYPWPGNVRELENAIARGVALCKRGWITLDELPAKIRERTGDDDVAEVDSLDVVERRHILKTLAKVNGNRSKAAALLQISTTTLWRRLKEFGVDAGSPATAAGRPVRNA